MNKPTVESTELFLKAIENVLDKEVTRIGITKKNRSPNKKVRSTSKNSRKINRTKKRHKKTSKEKKNSWKNSF